MKRIFIYILTLAALLLSSCSQPLLPETNEPDTTAIESKHEVAPVVPTLEAGKAALTGRVIAESDGKPIVNTAVRLADVVRQGEGAFVLDIANSPGDYTDDNGYFVIPNIQPIEYVIVIGDIYGQYKIIEDETGRAKAWPVPSGETVDVGEFVVDLPHP